MGGLLEISQGMMSSGRTASLFDGFANSLGTGLGILAAAVIMLRFNK